jgi:hypothetical protein
MVLEGGPEVPIASVKYERPNRRNEEMLEEVVVNLNLDDSLKVRQPEGHHGAKQPPRPTGVQFSGEGGDGGEQKVSENDEGEVTGIEDEKRFFGEQFGIESKRDTQDAANGYCLLQLRGHRGGALRTVGGE